MNKTLLVLISILIILLASIFVVINNNQNNEKQLAQFNSYYTNYLDKSIFGSEVVTIISKAIDNNEKYGVQKDENGLYISDGQYSIKVYINIVGSPKTYEMEKINEVGLSEFIANFNTLEFTCTKVNFHEQTNRVSEVYIQEIIL